MLCIVNTFLSDLPKNPRNQYRALPIATGRQPLRKSHGGKRSVVSHFSLQAVPEPPQRQMRHPTGCLGSGACAPDHPRNRRSGSLHFFTGARACGRVTPQPRHGAAAPSKIPRRETLRRFPLFPSGRARASPKTDAPSYRMPRVRRLRSGPSTEPTERFPPFFSRALALVAGAAVLRRRPIFSCSEPACRPPSRQ